MATVEMSSDDLRAQLYTSLRGKGILDSLKVSRATRSDSQTFVYCYCLQSQSQLRTKLAAELQNSFGAVSPRSVVGKGSDSKPKAEGCAISVQVANSVVAEHLKRAGLEYSLSVFLPEVGMNIDKVH